jgi:heat shock protein HslJ
MNLNFKTIMLKTMALAGVLMFGSCESVQVGNSVAESDLTGEWKLTGVFLGDAIDTPCGYATKLDKTMTINFSKESARMSDPAQYSLSGQSAVNSFSAGYSLGSFDEKIGRGKIQISTVGGTKMAGPQELMDCERRYYDFIASSESYEIDTDGDKKILRLGRLKDPNAAPSRDGGTYLIFEK